MFKILVVDDEANILNLVVSYLKAEGYDVYTASDGSAALRSINSYEPDLIILDIMLPGIDGLEVLSRLRRDSSAYVILLTAKTDEIDKIVGLSVGADDYMTKPFSPRELVARVKAALRRLHTARNKEVVQRVMTFNRLLIDPDAHQVKVDDTLIKLTSIEFDLLTALVENSGRVLTREQLLEKVWGYDYYGDTRVVDVHLGHVRQKLGLDVIVTVRGVGYRFLDEQN